MQNIILFLGKMAESIKKDKRQRTLGGRKRDQIKAGSVSAIPIGDDWVYFDQTYFTYNDTDSVSVSTIAVAENFQNRGQGKTCTGGGY